MGGLHQNTVAMKQQSSIVYRRDRKGPTTGTSWLVGAFGTCVPSVVSPLEWTSGRPVQLQKDTPRRCRVWVAATQTQAQN